MILYFSGGGQPWIPEKFVEDSAVMFSYYVHVSRGSQKPGSRLRRVMKKRKAQKKKGTDNASRT